MWGENSNRRGLLLNAVTASGFVLPGSAEQRVRISSQKTKRMKERKVKKL
jgi:hypothetical protein